jgi:outer membrane protein assembly factor BamD (BamD/ComL family)
MGKEVTDKPPSETEAVTRSELAGDRQGSPSTPDDLYDLGMAHYRRREWRKALDAFSQLKALDPERRGIEALLSELEIFIKLQEIGPKEQIEESIAEEKAAPPAEQPKAAEAATEQYDPRALLIVAGIVGLIFVALIIRPLLPANQEHPKLAALYDQGQARLAAQDYEGAIAAFEEILSRSPGDERAEAALEQARRSRTLDQLYREAQQEISAEDWEGAAKKLAAILSLEPGYRDARSLETYVNSRQHLVVLYNEGVHFFDRGDWVAARQRFAEVYKLDSQYQTESVQQYLFLSFLNEGLSLINGPTDSTEVVRQAVDRFGDALRMNPRNERAQKERQRAVQFLQAHIAFDRGRWEEAINYADSLYNADPDYASGKLVVFIYQCYLELGKTYESEGNDRKALLAYQAAVALPVPDPSEARAREQAIALRLYPPTPTVVPTPTPEARASSTARKNYRHPSVPYVPQTRLRPGPWQWQAPWWWP